MVRFVSSLVLVLVAACGDDAPVPLTDAGARDAGADGGVANDAGGGVDAGGAVDAGPLPDAGPRDDAGVSSMPCTPAGCDPWGDDCEEGEVCVLGDEGVNECREATASGVEGDECVRMEDCASGFVCVNGEGGATCQQSCPAGSVGFCGGEGRCSGDIGDECVRLCRSRPLPCDVYAQDCPAEQACTLTRDPETSERYTGCRPAGEQSLGEPCSGGAGTCARGLICVNRGTPTCHEVCAPEGGTCMSADETCSGLSTGWSVMYCRPPAD